jgi:hypothetical protein
MGFTVRQAATTIPIGDPDALAARGATFQARQGNLKRAANKLDQNAVALDLTPQQVRAQLVGLHPHEDLMSTATLHALDRNFADADVIITTPQALEAVAGMSKGASPGPTGWTSELLAQAMKEPEIANAFATVFSDIASGNIDSTIRDRLISARLVAIPKEPTKVRPIAVGEVFLKAASIVMFSRVLEGVGELFKGLQFGVGMRGGAEVVIHNVRHAWDAAVTRNQGDFAVCTIDCTNAFNALKRTAIVAALARHRQFAKLLPLLDLEYGSHSKLWYGDRDHLISASGVRQGSVLGPFWFALAIHEPVREVLKRFPKVRGFMYLDDVTLHGPAKETAAAADAIGAALAPLGLEVNAGKCEWLAVSTVARTQHPKGYKIVEAIKVLGAYIGVDHACRTRLLDVKKKHVNFFRRLPLLEPDIAAALLEVSGIPRVSYYARTHHPDVILPFLQEFDTSVLKAWMKICDITSVSQTTKTLASLPASLGGGGFIAWADRCMHAYAASREASLLKESGGPLSMVRESDRVLAAETKIADELRSSNALIKSHMEASKGCIARIRDTTTALYFPPEGISALFRWLMLAPHTQLTKMVHCPGCLLALTGIEFFGHVVGCARCHGYNASSRHAGLKKVLLELWRLLGLSFDTTEPRAFNAYTCMGCRMKLAGWDEVEAHVAFCEKAKAFPSKEAATDRSGPDGRVCLPAHGDQPARSIVYDVTILSTTAQTHRDKSLVVAWAGKTREKDGKYKEKVVAERPGQEFIVIGGTAFGELSASTQKFLRDCIAASNSAYTYDFIARKFSAAIAFCSGHVIAEAERRAGVVHQPSPLQIVQKLPIGRKGTAGFDVANNDGLWSA